VPSWSYDGGEFHGNRKNGRSNGQWVGISMPALKPGDVLGCIADIDNDSISYSINGIEYDAYQEISLPVGAMLHPALNIPDDASYLLRMRTSYMVYLPAGHTCVPYFNKAAIMVGKHKYETALMAASTKGHIACVKSLLAHAIIFSPDIGVSLNEYINKQTNIGFTCLMMAAR
jgi:hypothetical protein